MQEKEDFGGIGIALREGEEVEVGMSDVEVLRVDCQLGACLRSQTVKLWCGIVEGSMRWLRSMIEWCMTRVSRRSGWPERRFDERTFIPSSEKHGGTAELSSSASLSRIGNFSTADMGISPL